MTSMFAVFSNYTIEGTGSVEASWPHLLASAAQQFVLRAASHLDHALNGQPVTVQAMLVSVLPCVPHRDLHNRQGTGTAYLSTMNAYCSCKCTQQSA